MKKEAKQILFEQLPESMWQYLKDREMMMACIINAMDTAAAQEGLQKLKRVGFFKRLLWLLDNSTSDPSFTVEKEFIVKFTKEMIENDKDNL